MARIIKKTVDAIEAGDKDRYLWDEDLTGFGLKVTPAGRKVFLVQYRHLGRTRRVTIGPLGKVTPDEARAMAKSILGEVASGRDPASERDRVKQEPTLGDLVGRFLQEHVAVKLRKRTAEEYCRTADIYLPAKLLSRRVSEIGRADIARLHHSLNDRPYQANRVLAFLSKLFNWAEKTGLRPAGENPCRHVEKFRERKRERFLSPVELERLGVALAESEQNPFAVAAVRLLVFTGARLSEILGLRWDWIDFDRGTARLPDSKTGPKTIYLNPPTLEVLANLPRLEGNPYVICGDRTGAHLVNLQKPWRAIRKVAGLDDVRLHDLRHTFASVGAGGGASLPMIGALLGHSQPQTTSRYAHLAADPLKAASDAISQRIAASLGAGGVGKVSQLTRTK